MRLYYFDGKDPNFGDDLNPWFWDSLLSKKLDQSEDMLVGVGTLINFNIPPAKRTFIMGAGVGYGQLPERYRDFHYYCVRGPLSAQKLGLDSSLAITDPAILVSRQYPLVNCEKKYDISFMPHCDSDRFGDWKAVCDLAGIHYISPRQNFKTVFEEIARSKKIITEAMHGAIIADSYRVPFYPVKCYEHISDFKWDDWRLSMEMQFSLAPVQPVWRGEQGLPLLNGIKQKVKRALKHWGIWSKHWTPVLPAQSTFKTMQQSALQLKALVKHEFFLSQQDVYDDRQAKLLAVIDKFNHEHK